MRNKTLVILLGVFLILFAVGFYFLFGSYILDRFGRSRNYSGEKIQDYTKLPVLKGLDSVSPKDTYFDGPVYLNKNAGGTISLVVIEGVVKEVSYTDGTLTIENGGKRNKIKIKNNDMFYIVKNNPDVAIPKRTPASIEDIKIGLNISYNPPKLPEEPATIIIIQPYKR